MSTMPMVLISSMQSGKLKNAAHMPGQVAESVMFPSHFVEIIMFEKRCTPVSFTMPAKLDWIWVLSTRVCLLFMMKLILSLEKKWRQWYSIKAKARGKTFLPTRKKLKIKTKVENQKGQIYHGGKNR